MKASVIFIITSSALLLGSCRAQHAKSAQASVDHIKTQKKAPVAKSLYYVPVKGQPPVMVKAPAESGYWSREIPLTQLKPEDYGKVFCPKGTRSVVIPEGVVRIPKGMCEADLPSQLPDSYVYIEKVSLPSTLKSIGEEAFGFNKIKELSLPEGVERVGSYAFQYNELKRVTLPQSLQVIGAGAFIDSKIEHVSLPQSLRVIGDFAFAGNKLRSLTLPRRHELIISREAFGGNKLRSLVLPKNAELVGVGSFSGNELTQLTIEEGVTSIPPYAFSGNKFKGVTLPSTVTGLGVGAFDGDSLRDITILASRAPQVIYLKKGYREPFAIGSNPRYLIDGSGIKIHVPRDAKGYRGRWVWWGFYTGAFTVKHDATG